MITIEVIVAYYNGSAFIADQLESIQNNILPDQVSLQIKIIDDCSRADEFTKLTRIADRWPNVVVLKNESNLGVIRTFERGLNISTAPYVMLCDQDDIWLPDKITLTYAKMLETEKNQPALVFTDLTTVDQKLNTISKSMLALNHFVADSEKHPLLFQNSVTGCTVMVNRSLIEAALPFPPAIPMHDHWLAVCAAFMGQLGFVNQPTILYRQHSANLVGQPKRELMGRLLKPFKTIAQFNRGLPLKAKQASELAARLPVNSDRALIERVTVAFTERTVPNLKFLLRARVFNATWITLPLLCLLYLMPFRKTNAPR